MRGLSPTPSPKPGRNEASGSGTKPVEARPAKTASEQGPQASGRALKRSDSLPARPPSDPLRPAEVAAARKPVTRPRPDTRPPEDFRDAGGTREGAELKRDFMGLLQEKHFMRDWLVPRIEGSPYYKECLESMHPRLGSYDWRQKSKAYHDFAYSNPRLAAEIAQKRNELYTIPNQPTSDRLMKPIEQKFLTEAMRLIQEDTAKNPFHMHGESGAIGDRNGDVVHFDHSPKESVTMTVMPGDKYVLHSHPPFGKPFDSSPSETDHMVAAETYLEYGNKTKEYLTNGKEVMQIPPASLELIRLHPDPKLEETLGRFPEAFSLPEPQQPPRPFLNHEAPPAFHPGWEPPPGWSPPGDYPKDRSAG